jgi:ubiquinone/menaquinone biosynthesis C-methylase UbiE
MHTQDYEKIWDTYSDKFGQTPGTTKAENLGDEWGNLELSRERFEKFVRPHLSESLDVGELGVGGGKYSAMAAQYVRKLYGIDISDNMLARTAERLQETSCEFVPIKCADSKIALPDASLDVFFSLDSMVHIFPYDFFSYICELGRVLKPGSVAIIEYADWDQAGAVDKFRMDQAYFFQHKTLSPGAFGFISRRAMEQFAACAGLKVMQIQALSKRSSVATLQKP